MTSEGRAPQLSRLSRLATPMSPSDSFGGVRLTHETNPSEAFLAEDDIPSRNRDNRDNRDSSGLIPLAPMVVNCPGSLWLPGQAGTQVSNCVVPGDA